MRERERENRSVMRKEGRRSSVLRNMITWSKIFYWFILLMLLANPLNSIGLFYYCCLQTL